MLLLSYSVISENGSENIDLLTSLGVRANKYGLTLNCDQRAGHGEFRALYWSKAKKAGRVHEK